MTSLSTNNVFQIFDIFKINNTTFWLLSVIEWVKRWWVCAGGAWRRYCWILWAAESEKASEDVVRTSSAVLLQVMRRHTFTRVWSTCDSSAQLSPVQSSPVQPVCSCTLRYLEILSLHCQVSVIFGKDITSILGHKQLIYFSHLTWLVFLHYLAKHQNGNPTF